MELMGKDTILTALRELTGWEYRDNTVTKTFEVDGFRPAVSLFNRICDTAEKHQHHPDITLHEMTKVTVTLTSHEAGGVTQDDVKLATAIENEARNA